MTKLAFLFPGQGAQTVGMGQQAAESLPEVRDLFDHAREILGYDLAELCFSGPVEQLNSTVYSQPALFVCGLAGVAALRAENASAVSDCQLTAGLSLGEYTALVFADVMSFENGLRVVKARGEAMQAASDAAPSGMVSILGLELEKIEQLCEQARQPGEILQVANHLCPGNIVVSGHQTACDRAAELAEGAGAMKAIRLAVAGAFHTPLMDAAASQLARTLEGVELAAPRIPVISNVDAKPHHDPEEIRGLLVQQVLCPVRWDDSMRYLLEEGVEEFFEVGPGRVLRGLLKRINRKLPCQNVAV